MVWAQNCAITLEKLLVDFDDQANKAKSEFKKKNEDVTRLEVEVVELEKQWALAKKLAIKEFKSSNDFEDIVESAASKYSSKGFDFYRGILLPTILIFASI